MTAVVDRPPVIESDEPAEDVPRQLHIRTVDEAASLVGSLLGSLALVWVLFEMILGWSGVLGFLVCWLVAFIGVFAAVSSYSNPGTVVRSRVAGVIATVGALIVGFALATTIIYTFVQGWSALKHLNFYTHDMAGVRPTDSLTHGGVLHALIGTVIQVGIAILIALPIGVATAVYMTEENSALSRIVRTVVEAMTALADIIAGLFVYTVLIVALGTQRDGLAAAIALSVTMLPIIARSGFVVLSLVPGGLREAGLALGASRWSTVRQVVLPTARAGLATSLILGIARIAGETAPLLIVSGASTFINANPVEDPMNSLPLYIYVAVRSGQPTYIARGFGAASLLLALVLVLFVVARFLARNRGTRR
jgi:phosphate transport system permease protein